MTTTRNKDIGEIQVPTRADDLRGAMVAELRRMGTVHDERLTDALLTVPRHLFAPEVPLEKAYDVVNAVITKRDEHGAAISSVSAPEIQAFMLEQAEIRPGMNVVEYGSGGYNAALLAELVGRDGSVTTVDIDPEVTGRARVLLDAAGYSRVAVVLADAENGVPERGPYDRIILTVGAWDIPPAWVEQLAEDGRIVVPLRMRGLTRSLALDRDGDHLTSHSAMVCGFVKMQGTGAHQERWLHVRGEDVALRFDDDSPGAADLSADVLDTGRVDVWSGVTMARMESFATLQFWLATSMPGFCLLTVGAEHGQAVVDDGIRWHNLAAVDNDSFAYVVSRSIGDGTAELGVHAFGPRASAVAAAMAEQVRVWDRDHRHGRDPAFGVWPRDTPDERLPEGLVIDKHHSRVTVSWPAT